MPDKRGPGGPERSRPNILIVMTDHQRGDTALSEHPAVTPNLTRLAEAGVTFARTYCPSPHCSPARAAFHTGLYPSRSGVWNNVCNGQRLSWGLNEGVRCWSQDLAEAGYRMHWTGKWHVSGVEWPRDRGWIEHGVVAKPGEHHGPTWEKLREKTPGPGEYERGAGEIIRPGYGKYHLYRRDDDCRVHDARAIEKAVALLAEVAAGAAPWCLWVGLTGPHDPYDVPQKFLDLYDPDEVPLPPSFSDALEDKPRIYQRTRRQIWGQLSEREYREAIRHFWAYCSWLDDLFGRLMDALAESGQAENTLVVYTSDHGDYCGDHGLFAKGIPCFQGAYHVPAIIRWPAGVADPGRRVDELVSLADFHPTFLELAGVESDQRPSGASLAPFLRGETPDDWRTDICTQCNGVELYYTQRSIMTDEWKYVFNGFDFDELYHLAEDPHEMKNLADDPAYEDVKKDLSIRMWRFACREDDSAINSYITVGLAPYGPGLVFWDDDAG